MDLLLQFSLGGIWRLVYFIRKRHKSKPSDTLCRIDSNTTHLPPSSSLSLSLSLLRPFSLRSIGCSGMFRNQITIRGKAFFAVKATEERNAAPLLPLSPLPSFPLLLQRFQTAKAASCFLSVSLSFSPPSLARACGRNFFQSGRFYVSLFHEDIKRITTWIILGRPAGVVLPRGGRTSKRGNSVLASEIPPSPPTLLSPVPLSLFLSLSLPLSPLFFFFRRFSSTIILIRAIIQARAICMHENSSRTIITYDNDKHGVHRA